MQQAPCSSTTAQEHHSLSCVSRGSAEAQPFLPFPLLFYITLALRGCQSREVPSKQKYLCYLEPLQSLVSVEVQNLRYLNPAKPWDPNKRPSQYFTGVIRIHSPIPCIGSTSDILQVWCKVTHWAIPLKSK